jgi:hypothetical protein
MSRMFMNVAFHGVVIYALCRKKAYLHSDFCLLTSDFCG